MNNVTLLGRLTKDPEVKTTQSQKAVCSFTLAVDRRFKNASGERQADFISCVAWNQTAEILGKYFHKGSRMAITGSIQTRSYDGTDNRKVYVTEVLVETVEFVDSKQDNEQNTGYHAPAAAPQPSESFYPAMDDDTTLPFDL